MVKGCDSRAIVVLLQEKFIERGDVFILGVSCEKAGVIDDAKLAKKLAGKRLRKSKSTSGTDLSSRPKTERSRSPRKRSWPKDAWSAKPISGDL